MEGIAGSVPQGLNECPAGEITSTDDKYVLQSILLQDRLRFTPSSTRLTAARMASVVARFFRLKQHLPDFRQMP